MQNGVGRRRQLPGISATLATVLAFVDPATAQGSSVSGLSPVLGAVISVVLMLGVCIVLLSSLRRYTVRTSDIIITSPISTLVTGIGVTFALLLPFIVLLLLAGLFDALGLLGLGLLTALSVPLLTIFLMAAGIAAIATGRRVNDKDGVVLLVVTVVATLIGAIPLPLLVVGVLLTVFGVGAMFADLRHSESDLEATERETYGKQHRYM